MEGVMWVMSVPSSKFWVGFCWVIHVLVLLFFVVTIVLPMCRVVLEQDWLPSTDKRLPGNGNVIQAGTVLIGAVVAAGLGMKPPLTKGGQRKLSGKRTLAGLGDILSAGIQPPGKTRKHLAQLYLGVYVFLAIATWVILWYVRHDSATLGAPKIPAQLEDFKFDSVALIIGAAFGAFRDPVDYKRTPYSRDSRDETDAWPQ
jgi:hypothetical protein